MRKTLKTKKLLFPLVMVSVSVLVGCTNSDYDFNEIDMTLGLGGGELVIPTSSTKEIALDDILKLEEGESVRILDNGDYAFVQDGDIVETNANVEKVTLTETDLGKETLKLKDYLPNDAKNTARAGELSLPIEASPEPVLTFEFEADQPEIVAITSAKVTANMMLIVNFSPELAQCISSIDALVWELPMYMEIGEVIGHNKVTCTRTDKENRIVLKDVPTNKDLEIKAPIIGLDFTDDKELDITDGHLMLKGVLKLGINTQIEVTAEQLQTADKWVLESNLMLDGITIDEAVGKFEPNIDLSDLGDIEVSDTPDFLKEDGVNIDLANPQIIVAVDNEMDVPAFFHATLEAIDGGVVRTTIPINNIQISPETKDTICICRDANLVYDKYKTYTMYEVSNLSDLISTIPDRIKLAAEMEADHSTDASFVLGHEYTITTSYRIEAPIAFGENANIVYTDSIVDIHGELDGFELNEGAYLEVTADVVNNLPIFLSTKVTPLGVDENDLSGDLKVTVEDNLPAAKDGEAAQGTLKIKLEGDIQQLDKLMFTISGKAKDGTDKVTGVTLNKNIHSLKLDNVNAKIVGTVIYDAN